MQVMGLQGRALVASALLVGVLAAPAVAQSPTTVPDVALDAAQNEISSQLAEVESRELAHIENALVRMRDGHFGKCEGCTISVAL